MTPGEFIGARIVGGEPSEEQQRMWREQQRIAMIENYRQSVAMHAMIPLCARLEPDCSDEEIKLAARKAKRAANALCEEIFGEDGAQTS